MISDKKSYKTALEAQRDLYRGYLLQNSGHVIDAADKDPVMLGIAAAGLSMAYAAIYSTIEEFKEIPEEKVMASLIAIVAAMKMYKEGTEN